MIALVTDGRNIMKKLLWLAAPLFALAVTLGCQETPESKRAKKEVKEGADATVKALEAQRTEYTRNLQSDLDKLDDQLRTWKDKAKNAKDDAKVAMQKQIDKLQDQRDKLGDKMKDFKADTKEAWEETKKGLSKAYDELKDAFEKAKDSFK
jgi:peptidoglycan hydrolase CwlO-like protein